MARIVAIANRKGGVGKTTTALNLAYGLKSRGKRTLLVDVDAQHNSTNQFGAKIEGVATVYDILTNKDVDPHLAIQANDNYGDIIPGDDLTVIAAEKMSMLDSREYMLVDAFSRIEHEYDYIIIDCPPALDIIVKNALVAADEVIAPVNCESYSFDGLNALMEQIDVVRSNKRLNPDLDKVRVLLTQYDSRTKVAREYKGNVEEFAAETGAESFETVIRQCVKTIDAQKRFVPLFEYDPDCATAHDYDALIEEFLYENEEA